MLVCDTLSYSVLHFYQLPPKYSKGYWSYRVDTKSISNKTKRDNSKSKKARVVILYTTHHLVLQFYHSTTIVKKYSKRYSSYRADKKFSADTDGIRSKHSLSPHPSVVRDGGREWGHNDHKEPESLNHFSEIWKNIFL